MDKTELLALRAQVLSAVRAGETALRRVEVALGEKPSRSGFQPIPPGASAAEVTGGHRTLTIDLDADKLEADRRQVEIDRRELEKREKDFADARLNSLRFEAANMHRKRNEILWKIALPLIALLAAFLFRKLGLQ